VTKVINFNQVLKFYCLNSDAQIQLTNATSMNMSESGT